MAWEISGGDQVRTRLVKEFHVNVTWYEWGSGGEFWQRLSAEIYLDTAVISEYRLAHLLLPLCVHTCIVCCLQLGFVLCLF